MKRRHHQKFIRNRRKSLAVSGLGLQRNMSPEETRQRFRNLVTGVFMNDFSYTEVPFYFKTVFYLTPYSYRCCPCTYELEYMDFISDVGEVNETMFEKILQSIIDKQCPHVDSATDDQVNFTTIRGIHIAAALESDEVIQRYQHDRYTGDSPAGLLRITPCYAAILKSKPKSLHAMLDMYPYECVPEGWTVVYVYRSVEDQNSIRFKVSSFLEQCVRKDNPDLLNTFINWAVEKYTIEIMSDALKVVITHKHLECENILLQRMKMFADECDADGDCSDIVDCGAIAIIHNRHDVLERVLHVLSTLKNGDYKSKSSNLCLRLPRPKCKNVLEAYGISCLISEPIEDTVHGLLTTLVEYLDCDSDEIVTILKSIPGIEAIINSVDKNGQTALNIYLKYKLDYIIVCHLYGDPSPKPKIVKLLLDLGSDISLPFLNNETPLKLLLRERVGQDTIFYENLRWTVEMLLNENPEIEKHSDERSDSIALLALKLDMALLSQRCVLVRDTPALMKMNNSEISHSRHAGGSKNVLNFLLPLLIECGYPANRDNLLEAKRESLFPAEYEYIQRVLDTPRGLKMLCRDSLRNHFKGRKIWNYVEMIYAPESIKSFILLKKELLMLNE